MKEIEKKNEDLGTARTALSSTEVILEDSKKLQNNFYLALNQLEI
jgi:hypothetical protein